MDVTPRMLRHNGRRPLTVIRYPDGISGTHFYSKDRPKWTTAWIPYISIEHESKTINYLYTDEKAGVVWLANLASLELYLMQFEQGADRKPDLFIIDLDPDQHIV